MPANTLNDQVRAYRAAPTTEARNAIVMSMLPFIEKHARIATRRGGSMDEGDALSAASLAVMQAIEAWPVDRNDDFYGYADKWITGSIKKEYCRHSSHATPDQQRYAKDKGYVMPWFGVITGERDDGSTINVVNLTADTVERVSMPEAAEAFNQFMTLITPAQQQVMQLHYTNERSVAEIADDVGLTAGEVQRLLEDAHITIRDRLMEAAGADGEIIMTTFPDDVLEFGNLAIVEAAKKQMQPDRWLVEYWQRDHAARVSSMNAAAAIVIEQAKKAARKTNTSFAPPAQANRQPPRGLDAIAAANVAVMASMLDGWTMPDGRKLGDVRGDELETYIVAEVRRAAKHRGRATFYEALAKRVPADRVVRDVVSDDDVEALYRATSEKSHIEFAPKQKAVASV